MAKKAAAKKTVWVVRVDRGLDGWQDLRTFTNAQEADEWICNLCREKGYWIGFFNLVRREA